MQVLFKVQPCLVARVASPGSAAISALKNTPGSVHLWESEMWLPELAMLCWGWVPRWVGWRGLKSLLLLWRLKRVQRVVSGLTRTDSTDMNVSKLWEIAGGWSVAVHEVAESDMTLATEQQGHSYFISPSCWVSSGRTQGLWSEDWVPVSPAPLVPSRHARSPIP